MFILTLDNTSNHVEEVIVEMINTCLSSASATKILHAHPESPELRGVNIGVLSDLSGFNCVQVIYLVNEERTGSRPLGKNACLLIEKDDSMCCEMSENLSVFWPIWQSEQRWLNNRTIVEFIREIGYFLKEGKPKTTDEYRFRDGGQNERLHRIMRSEAKCKEINAVFGYKLEAGDG